MSDDFSRNVFIETELEQYRNFFSDDFATRLLDVTKHTRRLQELAFDLIMEWRAAAYTVSLPLSIIEHIEAYHNSFVKTGEINTTLLRLAEAVPQLVAQEVPLFSTDPNLIRQVKESLVKIGARVAETDAATKVDFSVSEAWSSYLSNDVYQLSIWGSQRLAYVAIYNSYENFLVHCVKFALGLASCRSSSKDFKDKIGQALGDDIRKACWSDDEVNIARLARHALSHAGGRLTEDLGKQSHGFIVRQNRIQVTPTMTKALFATLKERTMLIAEAGAAIDGLQ